MAGPLASVTPGAGIRSVPNPNLRQVNDIASGNASPPQMPPQMQGQQGQLPPQLLAAIMQSQGQGQGQPQMPPQMPQAPQQQAPQGPPPAIQLQSMPQLLSGTIPAIPSASPAASGPSADVMRLFGNAGNGQSNDLASQGRNGDDTIAHMQTGEINIPVNVQSPQLMQLLNAVFSNAGLNLSQFIVGSNAGSTNPQTGLQEFAGISALANQQQQNAFGMSQIIPSAIANGFTSQQLQGGGGDGAAQPSQMPQSMGGGDAGFTGSGAGAVGSFDTGKQFGDSINTIFNAIKKINQNNADQSALNNDMTGQTAQVQPVTQQQLPS